jgi:hypothetical protein
MLICGTHEPGGRGGVEGGGRWWWVARRMAQWSIRLNKMAVSLIHMQYKGKKHQNYDEL